MAEYSPLLLQVTRASTSGEDEARDAYVRVLEALSDADYRRLRAFEQDGRASFRTWLAVVSRRVCRDFLRSRYGRSRTEERTGDLEARRRLVELAAADVDLDHLAGSGQSPEVALRVHRLTEALETALAGLDPEDRLLVRLRFEDDVPVREIAEVIGAPTVFHVYRRVNRVLGQLRKVLESAGVDGPRP